MVAAARTVHPQLSQPEFDPQHSCSHGSERVDGPGSDQDDTRDVGGVLGVVIALLVCVAFWGGLGWLGLVFIFN